MLCDVPLAGTAPVLDDPTLQSGYHSGEILLLGWMQFWLAQLECRDSSSGDRFQAPLLTRLPKDRTSVTKFMSTCSSA